MSWIDSLINGVVTLGTGLGGKAIEGKFNENAQQIANEGLLGTAFIQGNADIANAGWAAVAQGYTPSQSIAGQFGSKYQSQASVDKARVEAEASRNQLLIVLIAVAAGAVLVFVFFMASRKE